MRKTLRLGLLSVVAAVLTGCTTPMITNLTPSRLPRKGNAQYAFSVEYATRQSTILKDTFKAYVIIGNDRYPMERTPLLENRWETLVPIAAQQEAVAYRYRFEYEYKAMPVPKVEVRDTQPYQLTITGR